MGKYGLAFDTVESPRQLQQLGHFLRTNPGVYDPKKHEAWIDGVCLPDIENGNRLALAWWQQGEMIGDAVLKVAGPDRAELKNFRVASPNLMHRGLAGFLLRQIPFEAVELLDSQGAISGQAQEVTISLDTTAGSPAAAFFEYHGFQTVGQAELYEPGRQEVFMELAVPLN